MARFWWWLSWASVLEGAARHADVTAAALSSSCTFIIYCAQLLNNKIMGRYQWREFIALFNFFTSALLSPNNKILRSTQLKIDISWRVEPLYKLHVRRVIKCHGPRKTKRQNLQLTLTLSRSSQEKYFHSTNHACLPSRVGFALFNKSLRYLKAP